MKLKQIESILKQEKTIIVAETAYCQWLGNGSAFYPVYGLPKLEKDNIFTLFDVSESKREKYYFEERPLPAFLNFEDADRTEAMLERGTIGFTAAGRALEPLKTSQGIAFINSRYLKPFADEENGYELYERTDKNGRIYIAVKAGFILLGIIAPFDLVNEQFIKTMESILDLSRIALYNKEQKRVEAAEQMKTEKIEEPTAARSSIKGAGFILSIKRSDFMRNYKHLTFTDRLKIEAWERVKTPPRVMAEELGVHISTIYRELKRGRYERLNSDLTTEDRYSPDIAEQKYQESLKAKGAGLKIGKDHEYATYLEYKVSVEKYAPGAILGEIKRKGIVFDTTISKTTFYRYIEDGVFLTITNKDLPVKRNKDKKKYDRVKPSRAPKGKSIEKRPEEIATRETFGNWEMDSVEGKKGTKKTLLVLTERKTRREIIRLMKDKTAASVVKELDKLEEEMGSERFSLIFKTITVDNGSEFSDYEGIERYFAGEGKRTEVYFCHPYSSYERGSNENQNKMIRRHYPKGYDFTEVTPADIRKLEKWINDYPRGIFDYYSSADLYEACLNSIFAA